MLRMRRPPTHRTAADRRLRRNAISSILAVCGNLNPKLGGPSIHPTIPRDVLAGQSIPGNGWDLKCPPEERGAELEEGAQSSAVKLERVLVAS